MNKNILGFLSIAFTLGAQAQPTITRANLINTGSVEILKTATVTYIDTTLQGANVNWDYSGLIEDTQEDVMSFTFVNPANTPYSSSFPNANYCYREVQGSSVFYAYFNLTNTKLERIGSGQLGGINTYSDPQIEMVFPFTYGSTSVDTWESTSSSFGGKYSMNGIGYGTLRLPDNTIHNNVLMVRIILEEIFETPTYFWYSEEGAILLQYFAGDGLFIPELVRWTSSVTLTGINEKIQQEKIASFANPITDKLMVTLATPLQNDIQYTLLNAMGTAVKSGQLNKGESLVSIDVDDLADGIYYFTSSGQYDSIKSFKILKH